MIRLPYGVVLYHHPTEQWRQTNSGRLIVLAVEGSGFFQAGDPPDEEALDRLVSGVPDRFYLVFPEPGAISPREAMEAGGPPPTFIFLDGTWRQARRMRRKLGKRHRLPAVSLAPGGPSRYRLRRQGDETRLCTAEAAVLLMRELDDGSHPGEALDRLLHLHIQRQLSLQGVKDRVP